MIVFVTYNCLVNYVNDDQNECILIRVRRWRDFVNDLLIDIVVVDI